MLWVVYLLPLVTGFVLYILYQPLEWWWLVALALACDGVLYGLYRFFRWFYNRSTEYHGSYATRVLYYESWNELCSRQVPIRDKKGNTVGYRTEYYVVYHPAEWWVRYNTGESEEIGRKYYAYLGRLWGTPERFHDMHRDYHTIDGDAYSYDWGGEEATCVTRTVKRSYLNPLKRSNSIFRYKTVTEEEAEELELYDYPSIISDDQRAVLGPNVPEKAENKFRFINAYYGFRREIRVFVLLFDATKHKPDVAERQRAYWHGGAKNEFVVCLGIKVGTIVEWCHTFSWMDKPTLDVAVEGYFLQHSDLNLHAFGCWLEKNLGLWRRKEFSDFKYLGYKLSKLQYALMVIAACGLCYLSYYIIDENYGLTNNTYNNNDYYQEYYYNP